MADKSQQDDLFSRPVEKIVDFVFDRRVAGVFPDMIRRSVPGYENIIAMTGLIAEQYVQDNSRVYDLGCSLGAATLSILTRIANRAVDFIAVDNARAMIDKGEENIAELFPGQVCLNPEALVAGHSDDSASSQRETEFRQGPATVQGRARRSSPAHQARGCVFHAMPVSDSTRSRSLIPHEAGHPFQTKAVTDSR